MKQIFLLLLCIGLNIVTYAQNLVVHIDTSEVQVPICIIDSVDFNNDIIENNNIVMNNIIDGGIIVNGVPYKINSELPIDSVIPTNPSNERAPSTLLFTQKVNEFGNEIYGGQKDVFNHSTFDSNGTCPIDDITLSNIGDYIEILAKVNWVSGSSYIVRNSSSRYTAISYSGANKIFVRLMSGGQTITAQDDAYKSQVKIKLVLDNIAGTTYSYKVLINDNVQTGFATSSSPAKFNQCGIAQMDLYYVKYKFANEENVITEFGQKSGSEGIVDLYDTIVGGGIKQDVEELKKDVDKIPSLEDRIKKLEGGGNMFYTFKSASGLWDCDSHFTIYQKVSGNKYIGTNIGLYSYVKRGLSDGRYYWRMISSNLYTYADGIMTKGIELITSGENEFVLQWQGDDKTSINFDSQYSGGFHGGEYCNLENCYVEFVVNGNVISIPTNDVVLTPISSFSYREKSAIKEKLSGGIGCYHIKETFFGNGGYKTENRIDLQMAIPFYAYFGIVCVNRNISEYAMAEKDNALTNMGSGTPLIAEQFKSNNHKIVYQGSGLQTIISSNIDFGDDDDACELVVYNSTSYNKYYRKSQVIPANVLNKVKGTTIVKIEDL